VPSSQALPGYFITAPPSVCVPAVIGVLAVRIQKKKNPEVIGLLAVWRYNKPKTKTKKKNRALFHGPLRECL